MNHEDESVPPFAARVLRGAIKACLVGVAFATAIIGAQVVLATLTTKDVGPGENPARDRRLWCDWVVERTWLRTRVEVEKQDLPPLRVVGCRLGSSDCPTDSTYYRDLPRWASWPSNDDVRPSRWQAVSIGWPIEFMRYHRYAANTPLESVNAPTMRVSTQSGSPDGSIVRTAGRELVWARTWMWRPLFKSGLFFLVLGGLVWMLMRLPVSVLRISRGRCPSCAYPEVPTSRRCPECGREYPRWRLGVTAHAHEKPLVAEGLEVQKA